MNVERYKADIEKLAATGSAILLSLVMETQPELYKHVKLSDAERKALPDVRTKYQAWYSEALVLITQLLPLRVDDFVGYYKPLRPRKEITYASYTMSDYLQGLSITRGYQKEKIVGPDAAVPALKQQVEIVQALQSRFESSLFDIRAMVQADFFDNELDAGQELNKKGFHRAAGALAGVVLEEHLATTCDQHKIKYSKAPSIGELNDLLKKADVIDVPTWRFIQRLGDLRNLCDHKRTNEPTRENIDELADGVRKTIKTVF